jgi:vacuolar-type H+-ATPase subunit I/STV1
MAGKKKSMEGGRVFDGFFGRKPTDTTQVLNYSNAYLNTIRELKKSYSKIDSNKISVNNLNTKVKSLSIFSQKIKNKEGLMPLLDVVKGILIEKLFKKLGNYNAIFQNYDSYNFSQLLSLLQDFEKLTDLINLLGGSERNNLGSLKIKKNQFIAAMLNKYEEEILSKLHKNFNSQIELLKKEVEDYISKYSQFTVEIGTKRGANNSINSIVHRLSKLFEKIEQFISQQNTSQNRSQQNTSQNRSQQNTSQNRSQQNKIARFISVLENLNYDLNTNRMNKIKH